MQACSEKMAHEKRKKIEKRKNKEKFEKNDSRIIWKKEKETQLIYFFKDNQCKPKENDLIMCLIAH